MQTERPIRVLVAKVGLDGHDRGAKVIATALRDAGMEVIYTGLRQSPEMVVQAALQEDVDAIGISILSGAHMTVFPKVYQLMVEKGLKDVLLTGGGIIPEEDNKTLAEVRVVGSQDKTWEKQFRAFERGFIGENYNRKEVYITNREVVDFTENKEVFSATASQPLQVINKTLGYRVTYFLYDFEKTNSLTSFKGLASFQPLVPEDARQERRWKRNRVDAYEGSIKHFLKSFVDNRLEEEGFNAFLLKPEYLNNLRRGLFFDRNSERHISFNPVDLIGAISPEGLITLNWDIPMEIVFNRKRVSRPVFMDAPYPYTILIPKGLIQVTSAGDLMNPYSIEMRGEMGKIGMADLLPLDFDISQP